MSNVRTCRDRSGSLSNYRVEMSDLKSVCREWVCPRLLHAAVSNGAIRVSLKKQTVNF